MFGTASLIGAMGVSFLFAASVWAQTELPVVSPDVSTDVSTADVSAETAPPIDSDTDTDTDDILNAGDTDSPPAPDAEVGTEVKEPAVPSTNPEMDPFDSLGTAEQVEGLNEDPLDDAETDATMAVVMVDVPADASAEIDALLDDMKPFAKGDMELSIGIGGAGGTGSFSLSAGAVFAYYVQNRFAPGLEIAYRATWGDYVYPQSLTLFPFLKYVLVRSKKFAPYVLAGGGRTFEWAGVDNGFNPLTGEFKGFEAVSAWVVGFGGGLMIGVGARLKIQIQLLAVYQMLDKKIRRDVTIEAIYEVDANGNIVVRYEETGKRTDKYWIPCPSFWLSFAL